MGIAIGNVLPLALAIAISPAPIVAVLLLLLSGRATHDGIAFLVGWIVGISALTLLLFFISAGISPLTDELDEDLVDLVKVLTGAAMLVAAAWEWRHRRRPGDDAPPLPRWMQAADRVGPGLALLMGIFMSFVSPKNWMFTIGAAAGVAGAGGLEAVEAWVVAAVFVLIASAGVAAPVAYDLVEHDRAASDLEQAKTWLIHNNAIVVAVLLVIIGFTLLGEGLGGLTA